MSGEEEITFDLATGEFCFHLLKYTTGVLLLTISLGLTTTLNLICFCVVVAKSPKQMRHYSIHLAVYQGFSTFADLLLGTLLAPYFVFPIPGGLPMGILWPHVSTEVMIVIGFSFVVHMLASLVNLFVVRHQMIISDGHYFKFTKKRYRNIFYTVLHLIAYFDLGLVGAVKVAKTDLPATKKYWTNKYKILGDFIADERFFAFSLHDGVYIACHIAGLIILFIFIIIYTTVSSILTLKERSHELSKRTLKMQRSYGIALVCQALVPFISAITPVLVAFYAFAFESTRLTGLMPWAVLVLASHGFLSSIITLSLYRPYRICVMNAFYKTAGLIIPGLSDKVRKVDDGMATVYNAKVRKVTQRIGLGVPKTSTPFASTTR